LITSYLQDYASSLQVSVDQLLALGRADQTEFREPFDPAYLAIHGSGCANAVSRLHRRVSQRIFQPLFPRQPQTQVPIGHITNGVHVPSWDSAAADTFWTESCGKNRWIGTLQEMEQAVCRATDDALWTIRMESGRLLVEAVRRRIIGQQAVSRDGAAPFGIIALDDNTLTLAFARRFTGYKRPNLLLYDPERLTRILTNPERPAQLLVSGKAHPTDTEGQHMVRQWIEYAGRPEVGGRVIFVADYDLALAAQLVQGVDLWVNTPRRPSEACGTSGMKLLVNGGLNLSELDGWWAEAYMPEVGWALGDRAEHNDDPTWDAREALQLYRILEDEVVPAFYERNRHGIPTGWVAKVRASMGRLAPRFSSNRMIREYTERCYVEAGRRFRQRSADNGALALRIERWHSELKAHWAEIQFGNYYVHEDASERTMRVQIYFGAVDPEAIAVELYADGLAGEDPEIIEMTLAEPIPGAINGWIYKAKVGKMRPADDYTPRVVPCHTEALVPLEAAEILWLR
jgi:glycogen phosphorylase